MKKMPFHELVIRVCRNEFTDDMLMTLESRRLSRMDFRVSIIAAIEWTVIPVEHMEEVAKAMIQTAGVEAKRIGGTKNCNRSRLWASLVNSFSRIGPTSEITEEVRTIVQPAIDELKCELWPDSGEIPLWFPSFVGSGGFTALSQADFLLEGFE